MRHGGNVWEGGAPEKWLDFSASLRPEGPPAWVMAALRRALSDARYYPDRAMQAARHGLAEIRGDAALNADRRAAFADALKALGVRALPSQANFLLCDFGRDMTEAAARLKAGGILVRTCASFGLGDQWLRLAVRTEEENDRLIEELEKCLES